MGTIKDIELFDSIQNRVYKVTTDKGIFVIKEFSKDAIGNYYYLIYNFVEEKPLKKEELTIEHIKILATIQSNIHRLNIKKHFNLFI